MTAPYRIEFAQVVKITTTANRIGGDGDRFLSAPVPVDWDNVTLFGRVAYLNVFGFSITLYSDYARTTVVKTGSATWSSLPGSVSLGGGWSVSCAVFGPLTEGQYIDFTWFGGTDPQVGLKQGCFAWITGNPGYDGTVPLFHYDEATDEIVAGGPINPLTFAEITVFEAGMITANGLGKPSAEAEFSDGGSYGVMVGGETQLANAWPTSATPGSLKQTVTSFLQERSLSFVKAEVETYIVIDDVFYRWSLAYGSNPAFDDTGYTIPTEDPHAFIHGNSPKQTLSRQTYNRLPADNDGKAMPLMIGKGMAKLVQIADVSTDGIKKNFGGGTVYTFTGTVWNAGTRIIRVYIRNVTFIANDPRIVGLDGVPNYLAVLIPGTTGSLKDFDYFAPRIKSCSSTLPGWFVDITLSDDFLREENTKTQQKLIKNNPNVTSPPTTATWWFKIIAVRDFSVVSEGPINSFTDSPPVVYVWDEVTQFFLRQFGRIVKVFAAGGYPSYPVPAGMLLWPSSNLVRGEDIISATALDLNTPTVFARASSLSVSMAGGVTLNSSTTDFPLIPDGAPKLVDRTADYYRWSWDFKVTVNGSTKSYGINGSEPFFSVDVALPAGYVMPSGARMYAAINWSVVMNWPVGASGVTAGIFSVYAQCALITPQNETLFLLGPPLAIIDSFAAFTNGVPKVFNPISPDYIGGAAGPWEPLEIDPELSPTCAHIYEYLRNPDFAKGCKIRVSFYPIIKVSIPGGPAGADHNAVQIDVTEIALFSKSDQVSKDMFTKVTGVNFGTGWGTRTPARPEGSPVLRPGDAIEYLIRKQDLRPEFVDKTSFDAFASFRQDPTWFVGRQLLDAEDNFNRIQSLAEATFACVVPGKDGARQVRIIERYQEAGAHPEDLLTFVDALVGSIGAAEISMLDRLYTGVDLKYDQNASTEGYNCRLQTLNEDQSTFPAISVMVPGSDPPVPLWTTWVTGLSAFDLNGRVVYSGGAYEATYAAAVSLWSKCRAAYVRCGQKKPYAKELPWFRQKLDAYTGVTSSTEDAAFSLALLVAEYLFVPWIYQPLAVPITPDTVKMHLMDRVAYGDIIRTDRRLYYALVKRMELDTAAQRINLVLGRRATDNAFGMIASPPAGPEIWQDTPSTEGLTESEDQPYDGLNPIIQDT